jgi:hypothetical protein
MKKTAIAKLEAQIMKSEYAGYQKLINSGTWGLEGSVGRAMMDCIKAGACMLGPEGHRDYWGNYIPSRFEVKAGTKGSPEFVAERLHELVEGF